MAFIKWDPDKKEKPMINAWYRVIGGHNLAYWKIVKDFYNQRLGRCYWKIVDYYNGDIICCGKSLHYCREMIRQNCYKKGYDN